MAQIVIYNENLGRIAEQYCGRARRFTSRASSRSASGRTSLARTVTRTEVALALHAAMTLLDGRGGKSDDEPRQTTRGSKPAP